MDLTLKRNHGFELIFTADNVKIVEDIEERVYSKDENGKTLPFPKRDIKTEPLNELGSVLEDMIYYRKADFDSSSLIEHLFEKLPREVAATLSAKLKDTYELDTQE